MPRSWSSATWSCWKPATASRRTLKTVEAHALTVDTSTLTGESVPDSVSLGQELLAGTFVVEGEARAIVTAIGGRTRLAGIARLTRAGQRPPSPLARELQVVVRVVAGIAVGVGLGFFAIALALGLPAGAGFLFAIGVTVALVPEGLLPTVTLSLAVGAQRMARRNALVRRLESVETLGSTTFICTDKTGTLTRNEMAVVEVWTPFGVATIEGQGYEPTGTIHADPSTRSAIAEVAMTAVRCSNGRIVRDTPEKGGRWIAHGDPMEAALDAFARRLGVDVEADAIARPARRRFPFDPRRRRMSILLDDSLLVKGAPDAVLPRCQQVDGTTEELDRLAHRGLRVIAVAARRVDAAEGALGRTDQPDALEQGLELLGLVGLEDPPRSGAADAVAACRAQGIKIAMITGDHPGTARAIAIEVGLLGPEGLVLEGRDLPPDESALGALLDHDGVVVSRVTPEDKLRIARALHARGHVVAMTGDGVNDGPALQAADIGVAMGRSGTDVAREASDLVLLDDDFATIVAAVIQGRATYANIRRFLTYHLTDNVAELTPFAVWALSGGAFPLALGVLQVLCLDVVTDQIPALALGIEPPGEDVPKQPVARRAAARPRHAHPRLRRDRTGRGRCRDGRLRRRALGRRMASGRTAAGRRDAAGRLGRGVRGGRHRAGRERLRLPRYGQMARRAWLDHESIAARRRWRGASAARASAVPGAGRDTARPGATNCDRLAGGHAGRAGGPAGGRGAQAPVGRSSTATIVGLKAGVGRPTTPAGPR